MSTFRIKRVRDDAAKSDGKRVLVDRLWPRGLSKDKAELDDWMKDLAPSSELRTWFGHDPERFDEFATRFRAELDASEEATKAADDLTGRGTVTLLYDAKDKDHNNAVVLRDWLTERATKG